MEKRNRTQLVLGILLILVAGWLIAVRAVPNLAKIIQLPPFEWPIWVMLSGAILMVIGLLTWYVIGTGALLLVIGLLTGAPGMAIPACIVAGIGGILYYQNATGNWESWAYMWTLIPGFTGVGSILAGILGEDFKTSVRRGLNTLVISAILFAIFGTFFNAWKIFGVNSVYVQAAVCLPDLS